MPLNWRPFGSGRVVISNGVPKFPKESAPAKPIGAERRKVPGLYRLTLDNGYIYIGQASNLPTRFGNYRKPTQGTEQEHVIRYVLVDGGGATVEVFTNGDLSDAKKRRKLEAEEQNGAKTARSLLLNKGGLGYSHYLKFKIKYHADMLAEASTELEKLEFQSGSKQDALQTDTALSGQEHVVSNTEPNR